MMRSDFRRDDELKFFDVALDDWEESSMTLSGEL
jgi:hypothetical protein